MRRILIAAVLAAVAPLRAAAQDPTVQVDTLYRIVAIVGDSVISQSELQRAVELEVSQRGGPTTDAGMDSLREQILNDRIDALLLVQAAQRDTSIHVSDEEIRTAVNNQVTQAQSQFPSQAQFEAALAQSNLNLQEYRNFLTVQLRQQRLIDMFINRQTRERKPPRVTDDVLRQEFDRQVALNGGAPTLPPSLTFEQVVVPVTPSDTALARARAKADSLLTMIRDQGVPFESVARQYSDDTGTAEMGGDLGFFRPGQMTLAFERAVYSPLLRPGQVTDPVLTPYGYHIIRLERVRGPERNARHILIRPGIYPEDVERARELAENVAEQIRAGASIDSLRTAYGDTDTPLRLGPLVRTDMPDAYKTALAGASEGDVVGPFSYTDPLQKWAVVKLDVVAPERTATFEDYRDQMQQQVGRNRLLDEIVAELRSQSYVEIRQVSTN